MSTTRRLKQERPNRRSFPRKRDVRPKWMDGVAQKHPRRLSVGDSTSTSTISADGGGWRRYLTAALFFCPRLAESLSFAAFRPGFFRHSGESSSPSIVLGSHLALTTRRFQSHATQVPAAVRLHLRNHLAGVECRRKRLYGGRDAGIPLINPSLNNLPV